MRRSSPAVETLSAIARLMAERTTLSYPKLDHRTSFLRGPGNRS
jgi:hypothetical protein